MDTPQSNFIVLYSTRAKLHSCKQWRIAKEIQS